MILWGMALTAAAAERGQQDPHIGVLGEVADGLVARVEAELAVVLYGK